MTEAKGDVDVPAEFNLEFPEDILALAERFYNEWYNGGFSQLFSNWYPADVQLIPAGLRDKGHMALIDPSDSLRPLLWELGGQIDADALWKLIEDYELKLSEAEDDPGSEDKQ